ncbi:MAG TPA: LuxR C-terminal-related transcriptional regulator [Gemmatimonadaceae bacterium]|nr:LuxR C-terminal-related transcriptional regulator [Gemmatimonadaceae bacterium]
MTGASALARGREHFARQAWDDAYTALAHADHDAALDADDLERLASAAQMVGKDVDAAAAWTRAHTEFLKRDARARAAMCAYAVIVHMLLRGEMAQAGGWIARTRRLLDATPECVAHGFLLCAIGLRSIREEDVPSAHATFIEAGHIGERTTDANLIALARHGEGRALIRLGDAARGGSLLDEVMVAVTAGTLSPLIMGALYCSVLEACQEMYDVRRAQEWTDAMASWCARQPDTMAFRGQCLVHRAELMQLHGAWSGASEEAERALQRFLGPPPHGALKHAHYRLAELHRLRGDVERAEEGYRRASQSGLDPQPGLALLRLAQGQTAAAHTAIARAIEEARDPRSRAHVMPAYIEIAIAAGDVMGAREMSDELAMLAARSGAPMLRATAAYARGAVLLAEGDARGALSALRDAFGLWRMLEAPYEAARARMLIARACGALGDTDGAAMELACARETFAELGAAGDLAGADASSLDAEVRADAGAIDLTPRELEVLRLVATGKTNRAIAATLGISEKTIARHVSNIFTKLGLSSRAAATAYAYERRIQQRST